MYIKLHSSDRFTRKGVIKSINLRKDSKVNNYRNNKKIVYIPSMVDNLILRNKRNAVGYNIYIKHYSNEGLGLNTKDNKMTSNFVTVNVCKATKGEQGRVRRILMCTKYFLGVNNLIRKFNKLEEKYSQ